jgi:hypothetical protein
MSLARLEGEPLDNALERYPASFASKGPGRSAHNDAVDSRPCTHPAISRLIKVLL